MGLGLGIGSGLEAAVHREAGAAAHDDTVPHAHLVGVRLGVGLG